MQLADIWREHVAAGCPSELEGIEIAGSDARALDAEITACVSAMVCCRLIVDERVARRLTEIIAAVADKQAHEDEHVAAYCARLNRLLGAMLTEARASHT